MEFTFAQVAYEGRSFKDIARYLCKDPVRNIKNYSIIMNTLMRKAAERGSVHPLYLNRVSSDFARRIELVSSISGGYKLMEIFKRYYKITPTQFRNSQQPHPDSMK